MKKLVLFLLFIFVFQTLGFAACSPGYYAFRGGCPDCVPGYYCPGGDSAPIVSCNAPGFFCPDRSTTTYGNPASYVAGCGSDGRGQCTCDPGYYCPLGSMTSHGNAYPGDSDCPYGATCECPTGTYQPARGADSKADCAACDAGWWCPNPTTRNPCTAGHYCPSGSNREYLCSSGTYQPADNATSSDACQTCPAGSYCPTTSTIYNCTPGRYCPAGSTSEQLCDPGTYQPNNNATSEDACQSCPAGSYCPTPTEIHNCTAGHYCPAGSTSERLCDPGTYQPNNNATSEDACQACGDGYSCPDPSTRNLCPAGYYCSGGIQNQCDKKYFCPEGSTTSQGNPIVQNPDCDSNGVCGCQVGYYCPAGSKAKTGKPLYEFIGYNSRYSCQADSDCLCPAGYSCPPQSERAYGCNAGSYQPQAGQESCLTCPAGSYCSTRWLTAVTGTCSAGYACPEGSETPTQCNTGTYQPDPGMASCLTCPVGSYCQTTGLTAPTNLCPSGHFCPAGATNPEQCLTGRYQPDSGQSSCLDCPAGSYCNGTGRSTVSGICNGGYYCPAGSTNHQGRPYQPEGSGECTQNSVCSCSAGYYCPQGSTMRTGRPLTAASGTMTGSTVPYSCGINEDCTCTAGGTCGAQSSAPTACSIGTYQPLTGQSSCSDCPKGRYCATTGLSNWTGDCTAGYYCPDGSKAPTGQPYKLSGGCAANVSCNCSAGYYCPATSTTNQGYPLNTGGGCTANNMCACPAGTYQSSTNATSNASCTACSTGYYCPNQATVNQTLCQSGYYCPNVAQDHILCTAGNYCTGTGKTAVTGTCTAGYYCPAGSQAATGQPNAPSGGCNTGANCICSAGNYCPAGSGASDGRPFTNSTVTNNNAHSFTCSAGQTCYCPVGNRCPTQSASPIACTPGNYQDQQGQSVCKVCDTGYICNTIELSSQIRCPSNTTSPQGNTELRNCYIVTNNGISFMDSNSSASGLSLNQILGNVAAVTNVSEANRCYYNPI